MKSTAPVYSRRWFAADLIALMRPGQLFPIWATLVAGYAAAGWTGWNSDWLNGWFSLPFWLVFISVTTGSGAVFIYNQVADKETDAINQKLHIIPSGLVSASAATVFAHGLSAVTLLAGYFAGPSILGIYIVCGIVGLAYSLPPFQWKNHPVFSILVNGIGGAACFLAGYLVNRDVDFFSLGLSAHYFLSWAGVFILVSIPDRVGDAASGKRTPAVVWGEKPALIIGVVFIALSGLLSVLQADWIFFLAFAPVMPFYLLLLRNSQPGVFGPVKWSFVLLALVSAARFPVFFGILLANLLLLKLYYHFRFGINYPNLESHE